MDARDKILRFMGIRGPVLPVQIAQEIGSNILIASAYLSELSSNKKVKVSSLKVGGSPLYYLPGHEARLQGFVDNLPGKEKEAYNLLKQKKILRDRELDPVIRVALRQTKDFAFPLQVNYEGDSEIFWRWFLLTNEEAEKLVKLELEPEPVQMLETPTNNIVASVESKNAVSEPTQERGTSQAVPDMSEIAKGASFGSLDQRKPAISECLKAKLSDKPEICSANFSVHAQKHAPCFSTGSVFDKPAAPVKREVQEDLKKPELKEVAAVKPKSSKEKKPDNFLDDLLAYFKKNDIEVIEENLLRKGAEYSFVVRLPSPVGKLSYFCVAKAKKRIGDGDLSSAFINAQSRRLPVLFLTKGSLTTKANEMLEKEFKGMKINKV